MVVRKRSQAMIRLRMMQFNAVIRAMILIGSIELKAVLGGFATAVESNSAYQLIVFGSAAIITICTVKKCRILKKLLND